MLQARDVKEYIAWNACGRLERIVIQAIVDEIELESRNTKIFLNVIRRIFADNDNFVLPLREASSHDAAVKHSLPIVLLRHMERRKIVDGCDQLAGTRPKHPAITRHVKHIQAMLAAHTRQGALMPPDISRCGTIRFWHRHDL